MNIQNRIGLGLLLSGIVLIATAAPSGPWPRDAYPIEVSVKNGSKDTITLQVEMVSRSGKRVGTDSITVVPGLSYCFYNSNENGYSYIEMVDGGKVVHSFTFFRGLRPYESLLYTDEGFKSMPSEGRPCASKLRMKQIEAEPYQKVRD
jgi:hypothetical protein